MSCNDSEYSKNIIGDWDCTNWTNVVTEDSGCNGVFFAFDANMTYESKIQSDLAKGSYRIENGLLYCTPNDKMEIAVEILKLNKDTLQFTMSRSGNKEVMTLLKK
ncbi:hypothetical protein [Olleya sp. R77988]|uniref:hypothetical protein n=1 Tax=Olleya sp. R77988 TaxID=3093875 RepID=UPI0037CA845E